MKEKEAKVVKKNETLIDEIGSYWNERIHDLEMSSNPVGSHAFFKDLEEYRFDKLRYLPKVVDFNAFSGLRILEIGCGIGIDLARFAKGGALATGVDLSSTAIDLATKYFEFEHLPHDFLVMNGEAMDFPDETFDMVYAHGVIQYTADAQKLIDEAYRVLKPGGTFIGMVYNKKGWLKTMSNYFKVNLEHEDAPVLNLFTIQDFKNMLKNFSTVRIVPERFPVKSRLHGGLKGKLYNGVFVGGFNLIPRFMVRHLGWHIMAFAKK